MQTNEHPSFPGDLDLVSTLRSLWPQKWLILFVTILVFVTSLAYLLSAPSVYEARIHLVPPAQNEIANFNFGRTSKAELAPYGVKEVYEVFLQNLRAETLRQEFFYEVYVPALKGSRRERPLEELYEDFNESIALEAMSREDGGAYIFRVRAKSPENAVDWANAIVKRAGNAGRREMISNVTQEAEVRARSLEQQILTLSESGRKIREDRIVRLREALNIARAISLNKAPFIHDGLTKEISIAMTGDLVYMRGSAALEAEIVNLEGRKTDDPFLPGLRELQVTHQFFKNLKVAPESVAVYRVDGTGEVSATLVGPRAAVILPLGLIGGLLLGCMAAMCRLFYVFVTRQYAIRQQAS